MLKDISGKVDHCYINLFSDIKLVADNLAIPFLVVGATARDFIFNYYHGIKSLRRTLDVDLGVRVSDWDNFNSLINELLKTNKFQKTAVQYRLLYANIYVDILPFGKITGKNSQIKWPSEKIMGTLGFEEAYKDSIKVRINKKPKIEILLPSIPALIVMKLISWEETYPAREKDAEDLLFMIKNYEHTDVINRIYDEESSLMEQEGFDLTFSSIRLLGRDAAKIAEPKTLKKIKEILNRETDDKISTKLIENMHTGENDPDKIFEILKKFKQGVFDIKG